MRKLAAIGILTALLLASCQEAQITSYTVPREVGTAAKKASGTGERRLLVGMLVQPRSIWFFRLDGPVAEVGKEADAFKALVQSVRFKSPDESPTWTMPDGWTREPGNQFRYATLKVGSLEARVSRLGGDSPEAASVLQNLNRFRGEVGLPKATGADLAKEARAIEVNGVKGTWIDITGPGGKGGPPFMKF